MSRSSPVIAAACNLREYNNQKKKPFETAKNGQLFNLGEIDRLGGNGIWRQRLAETKHEEDQKAEAERLQEEKAKEDRKIQRRKALEARRRQQLDEEQRQRTAEKERERVAQELAEDTRRKKQERERCRREEEEAERRARMPKPCEACSGTATCTKCDGKGHNFSMFLVQSTQAHHVSAGTDFGRVHQGCDNCGGYRHNLVGELKKGTGYCPVCSGTGKIWPDIAKKPYRSKMKKMDSTASGADLASIAGDESEMLSPTASQDAAPLTPVTEGRAEKTVEVIG